MICYFDNPFIVLLIAFIAAVIIRAGKRGGLPSEGIERVLAPYVLAAAVPFLWYAFALNHSSIHYWFTNKALTMTVMAVTVGAADLLGRCREKKDSGIRDI